MSAPARRRGDRPGPPGLVFAADVGGTKVRAALAEADGTILAELVEPTVAGPGESIVAQVAALMAGVGGRAGVPRARIEAAGVGLPVAVDPRTGAAWSTQNVPGLDGVAVAEALRRALGIPVRVENDGSCAALGEGWAGAATGLADFAVVAIGTGVGCGIVSAGRLLRGARGGAGEIAYLPLGGDPWSGPARTLGAYESVVAGPAVRARVAAALAGDPPSTLRAGCGLAEVAIAAGEGDLPAARILDAEARLVALGIAAIAAVVDPEVVLLSGGVGAVPALLEPVRGHLAALSARPPRVATGMLGDRAPLVGAVALALDVALPSAPPGARPGRPRP